jgi:hypothetical protein
MGTSLKFWASAGEANATANNEATATTPKRQEISVHV